VSAAQEEAEELHDREEAQAADALHAHQLAPQLGIDPRVFPSIAPPLLALKEFDDYPADVIDEEASLSKKSSTNLTPMQNAA
jgi:hypothetical protein